MNPGIGMMEMLFVLVVALIFVGPRQLPIMMRRVGQVVGQARAMARDFQRSFDELGREAELDALRKEIEAIKAGNPVNQIHDEVRDVVNEVKTGKPSSRPRGADPFIPGKPAAKPTDKLADKPAAEDNA